MRLAAGLASAARQSNFMKPKEETAFCHAAKANATAAQIVAHRASDNSRTTISAGPICSGMVAVRADLCER
jgi:hypothetical protein